MDGQQRYWGYRLACCFRPIVFWALTAVIPFPSHAPHARLWAIPSPRCTWCGVSGILAWWSRLIRWGFCSSFIWSRVIASVYATATCIATSVGLAIWASISASLFSTSTSLPRRLCLSTSLLSIAGSLTVVLVIQARQRLVAKFMKISHSTLFHY